MALSYPGSFVAFGIDFGTTFSAVSFRWWSSKYGSDAVYDCSWEPGEVDGGYSGGRGAPTAAAPVAGSENTARWGFQVTADEEAFRWFKLALVRPEHLGDGFRTSAALNNARDIRRAHTVQPNEVAAAYLRGLWTCSLQQAAGILHMSVDGLARLPLHVVIGVPANWSPDALLRLRGVVRDAGIPGQSQWSTVEFLSEPDAAALTLLDPRRPGPLPNIGDVITVCDCGGGTADAISYEVLSQDPLSLQECVPSDSRLAGPVLFDDEFLELIGSKITPRAAPTMRASITTPELRKHFYANWESHIKPGFSVLWSGRPIPVPFEFLNLADRRRRLAQARPSVTLANGEIRALFDPAVAQITGLLGAQLDSVRRAKNKLPAAVILCGGYSGSLYLRSSVETYLRQWQQEDNDNVQQVWGTIRLQVDPLQHHDQTMLAVSRGCSRYALEKHSMSDLVSPVRALVRIASRLARASYGFAVNRHDNNSNNNNPRFLEFIAQGESLQADTPKRVPVDLARVRLATPGGGHGVCLVIFRSSGADRLQGRGTKYCEIVLTGPVAVAVDMAGCHVVLTAVAGSACPPVVFGISVGGEQQQGDHVAISYEQMGRGEFGVELRWHAGENRAMEEANCKEEAYVNVISD